jgi:hypothetical protein
MNLKFPKLRHTSSPLELVERLDILPLVAPGSRASDNSHFLFDSGIAFDLTRSLVRFRIDAFVTDAAVHIDQRNVEANRYAFDLTLQPQPADACAVPDAGTALLSEFSTSDAKPLATITIDFDQPPFVLTPQNAASPARPTSDALAAAFLQRLRTQVFAAFAAAIAGTQPARCAAGLCGAGHVEEGPVVGKRAGLAHSPTTSFNAPTGRSRRRWLKPTAIAVVVILLAYGLFGALLKPAASDPFAGIDPSVRKSLEAAGLRGANNPGLVPNVTEDTLRAMGLDPGKAADLGCLAK